MDTQISVLHLGKNKHGGLCPDTCKRQAHHSTKLGTWGEFISTAFSFVISLFLFLSGCYKKKVGALMLCAVIILLRVYRWQLPHGACSSVSPEEWSLWRMLQLWGWQVAERCCSGLEPELELVLEPKPAEEPWRVGPTLSVPTPSLKDHREDSLEET